MAHSSFNFKVSDIVTHFKQLEASGHNKWWKNYIVFDWTTMRESATTKWMPISYTPDLNIPHKKLIVSIRNEVHTGRIMPLNADEIPEIRTQPGCEDATVRTMKPSLQFQKWNCKVHTEVDGVTIKKDSNGNDILPSDEYLSDYYQFAEYMALIFKEEFEERIRRGNKYDEYIRDHKKTTAEEAKKFVGYTSHGDIIITSDVSNTIKSIFNKDKQTSDKILEGVLIVSSAKLGTLVQTQISSKAKKNKDEFLPNPIARVTLVFDTKNMNTNFLDKTKPIYKDGKITYDYATVNGVRINSENVHKFILSKSVIDGIINFDSVCFSQMCISIPVKASLIVVQPPVKKDIDIASQCANLYGDELKAESSKIASMLNNTHDNDDHDDIQNEEIDTDNNITDLANDLNSL